MIDYNDLTKNIKDGLKFPTGATSERGNPSKGSLRFNSETGKPEIYAKSRGWKTEASSVVYKVVVGAYLDDDNGSSSGAVYVYDLDGSNEVKITASDGAGNDKFGRAVAVAFGDSKIAVGSYLDDDNGSDSGSVYVYELDGSNEVKITASDGSGGDEFGHSIAVGNSKIVVGASGYGSNSGAVYVYDLDGSNEVKITASDANRAHLFGSSVAIDDSKIVVGANNKNGSKGGAYIYDLDGSNEVILSASDAANDDYFGISVAVAGSKVLVGAYWDDDNGDSSGSVYIYDLDGSNEVKLTASDGSAYSKFGYSVAIG